MSIRSIHTAFQRSAFQFSAFQIALPGGDSGEPRKFPFYLPPPPEIKKRKPARPIWDRVKQQKVEKPQEPTHLREARLPPRIEARSPATTTNRATEVEKPKPAVAPAGATAPPAIGQYGAAESPADISRISQQMSDARDLSDISAAFMAQSQPDDHQDMTDIAEVFGHLSTLTH